MSPCGDLDFFGRCDDAVLSWCENDEVRVVDCAAAGEVCAFQDDVIGNNCVAPPIEEPIDEEPIISVAAREELLRALPIV